MASAEELDLDNLLQYSVAIKFEPLKDVLSSHHGRLAALESVQKEAHQDEATIIARVEAIEGGIRVQDTATELAISSLREKLESRIAAIPAIDTELIRALGKRIATLEASDAASESEVLTANGRTQRSLGVLESTISGLTTRIGTLEEQLQQATAAARAAADAAREASELALSATKRADRAEEAAQVAADAHARAISDVGRSDALQQQLRAHDAGIAELRSWAAQHNTLLRSLFGLNAASAVIGGKNMAGLPSPAPSPLYEGANLESLLAPLPEVFEAAERTLPFASRRQLVSAITDIMSRIGHENANYDAASGADDVTRIDDAGTTITILRNTQDTGVGYSAFDAPATASSRSRGSGAATATLRYSGGSSIDVPSAANAPVGEMSAYIAHTGVPSSSQPWSGAYDRSVEVSPAPWSVAPHNTPAIPIATVLRDDVSKSTSLGPSDTISSGSSARESSVGGNNVADTVSPVNLHDDTGVRLSGAPATATGGAARGASDFATAKTGQQQQGLIYPISEHVGIPSGATTAALTATSRSLPLPSDTSTGTLTFAQSPIGTGSVLTTLHTVPPARAMPGAAGGAAAGAPVAAAARPQTRAVPVPLLRGFSIRENLHELESAVHVIDSTGKRDVEYLAVSVADLQKQVEDLKEEVRSSQQSAAAPPFVAPPLAVVSNAEVTPRTRTLSPTARDKSGGSPRQRQQQMSETFDPLAFTGALLLTSSPGMQVAAAVHNGEAVLWTPQLTPARPSTSSTPGSGRASQSSPLKHDVDSLPLTAGGDVGTALDEAAEVDEQQQQSQRAPRQGSAGGGTSGVSSPWHDSAPSNMSDVVPLTGQAWPLQQRAGTPLSQSRPQMQQLLRKSASSRGSGGSGTPSLVSSSRDNEGGHPSTQGSSGSGSDGTPTTASPDAGEYIRLPNGHVIRPKSGLPIPIKHSFRSGVIPPSLLSADAACVNNYGGAVYSLAVGEGGAPTTTTARI